MRRKRNSFFTFALSFIPGAAEMYMGFMRMGSSLMGLFVLFSALFSFDGSFGGMTVLFPAFIWFFTFFHARNLAAYEAEELQEKPDVFIWEEYFGAGSFDLSKPDKRRKAAAALIILGLAILYAAFRGALYMMFPGEVGFMYFIDAIPRAIAALAIIGVGIYLIKNKKKEVDESRGDGKRYEGGGNESNGTEAVDEGNETP